ncbi:hypothetical protein [Halobellus limi]|uniref:Uncharacterized protein n=1 Tax=Halobellus limi TaxID=699433 RepID=A0A1H5U038_9EURY|nr:hypothetical protein [Halobellus limi]QCC47181.1 hypothetical protein DV707_05550 [Halobellus limi]SEF68492.1 hypothetical protein SAMN04488133_0441 [Halobellus limi]
MTEFTFFEIHLHDGLSFSATNTAPAIGGSGEGASDGGTEQSEAGSVADEGGSTDDGSPAGGRSGQVRIGAVVALVLLVALAAAAKYLRGGDDAELTELDDFAEE